MELPMKIIKARITDEDYKLLFTKTKGPSLATAERIAKVVALGLFLYKKMVEDRAVYVRESGKYVRLDLEKMELDKSDIQV
jgi:hypothetical protein